jgi:hypothetical protein
LLQQHLFRQDVFAERFQTKFDQERITSEVLNSRFCITPHLLLVALSDSAADLVFLRTLF